MTYEEAIRILDRRTTIPDDEVSWGKINTAIDLAIEALEEVEEWHKLKLICANEDIVVYKIRGDV